MIQFIKMKRDEIKLKAMLHKSILSFLEHQDEIMDALQKLYIALKDIPEEEMQNRH